jgi:hypothetical protein
MGEDFGGAEDEGSFEGFRAKCMWVASRLDYYLFDHTK